MLRSAFFIAHAEQIPVLILLAQVKPALPMQSDVPVAPLSTAVAESTQPDQNSAEFAASAALDVDFFANVDFDFNFSGPVDNSDVPTLEAASAADFFRAVDRDV